VDDIPLRIFALTAEAPPLRILRDALIAAGYPIQLTLNIVGEASEEDLSLTDWEAAFVRWTQPELHEICLIERSLTGEEDEAVEAIATSLRIIVNTTDIAGGLIVGDHVRRSEAIYDLEILPALLADEDHPGFAALDVLMRTLATHTNGIIYVPFEGFCDADGEILLSVEDTPNSLMEPDQA
jgi:hypothetical protein